MNSRALLITVHHEFDRNLSFGNESRNDREDAYGLSPYLAFLRNLPPLDKQTPTGIQQTCVHRDR